MLRLGPREGWIIDRVSIAPLLVLGELTSLTIFTHCEEDRRVFLLSDKDIECLVKAMPKLEVLSLGTPCPEQMSDNLTVKSLLAIAKHCKALETLQMHINCESIVTSTEGCELPGIFDFYAKVPFEAISSDYHGCPLRSAIFGSCPIPTNKGGIILALTLLRPFPQLDKVRWYPFENLPPGCPCMPSSWITAGCGGTSQNLVSLCTCILMALNP